ncbi:hypothetical protein SVAN01_07593 [Stagonosporopsis vannaccii]|nr:hypothetical protein SVAN01_07593 [Stagonosporopsis vannaccii]
MHTLDFETWSSHGDTFGCCTEGVEDEMSASTTAVAVAQHLSTSFRNASYKDSRILYINATDQTPFPGITSDLKWTWIEKFLIQALSLHANTVDALQLVLGRAGTSELQALDDMFTQPAFFNTEALFMLIKSLLEAFSGPIIIGVDNTHEGGDDLNGVLDAIKQCAFATVPRIHLVIVSGSESNLAKCTEGTRARRVNKDKCLQSMSFEGQDTRRSQIAQSFQDTNAWIWQHPSYVAWESDRSSILWIEGKAGSGNTRGGRTLMSHASLLRAVLRQILQKDPRMFQHVREVYRRYRPGAASKELWESLPAMQDILRNILTSGFQVRVIIDAMDEAESARDGSHDRRSLLAFLRELTANAETSLKIIVSSRPLFDMEIEIWRHQNDLGNVHRIVLQEENYNTICTIVDHGIEALRKAIRSWSDGKGMFSTTTKRPITRTSGHPSRRRNLEQFYNRQHEREEAMLVRIKGYLLENAKGVVLWVISVLNILEATIRKTNFTFADLESKLKSIPVELSGLYEYHLEDLKQRFDSEELFRVRKVLMFVSGANAMKPLTLEELWDALAIPSSVEDVMMSELDPIEQGRIHISSWRDFWWTLHDMCGPLVEVVSVRTKNVRPAYGDDEIDAKDNVQLSHRTVQDFLARPESASVLAFDDEEAATFVRDTLRDYATIVMPSKPTPYTGPRKQEGDGWQCAIEDMAEYLDDKRLLPWIFDIMSEKNDFNHKSYGIFGARLQNSSNKHLVRTFGPTQHTESRAVVQHETSTINAHYIEYACSNGLVVATRTLLRILSLGSDAHLVYAILDAALLVAIRHEMVDLVTLLTASAKPGVESKEPNYRFWIEEEHDVLGTLKYLTPFEVAAAQTGNESLVALVYDRNHRVQKSMPWYLWPLLAKGRESWSRSAKDWLLYQEYTRKMKSEREQDDALPADDVRACIMLILQYASDWGYL